MDVDLLVVQVVFAWPIIPRGNEFTELYHSLLVLPIGVSDIRVS